MKQKEKTKTINWKTRNQFCRGRNFCRLLNRFMFSLVAILGLAYVVSVNDISIKGFILEDLQREARVLKTQAEEKEFAIIKLKSYQNISQRAENMNMVKVDSVDYLVTKREEMAKK